MATAPAAVPALGPGPGPSDSATYTFTTTFEPVMIWSSIAVCLQIILLIVPGVYYSRIGIANPASRRSMSAISFNLLLPAMSFYNIGSQLTLDTLYQIWPFVVNALLTNFIGQICGRLACIVFRPPRKFWAHVQTSCGFPNLNSMPLLLTSALCGLDTLPFYQYYESVLTCSSVGFGYVAIGSAANQILTYPFALYLLKNKVEDDDPEDEAPGELETDTVEDGSVLHSTESLTQASSRGSPSPGSPTTGSGSRKRSVRWKGAGSHVGNTDPADPMGHSDKIASLRGYKSHVDMETVFSLEPKLTANSATYTLADADMDLRDNRLIRTSSVVILPHGEHTLGFWRSQKGQYIRLPEDSAPFGEEDGQAGFIDAAEESMDLLALDAGRRASYSTTTFLRRRHRLSANPSRLEASGRKSVANMLIQPALPEGQEEDNGDDNGGFMSRRESSKHPKTRWAKMRNYAQTLFNLCRLYVFKPPAVGALSGIVLVCIPTLQNLLFPQQSADLGFISGALRNISNALVFVSSFAVGGAMSKGPGDGTKLIGWGVCAVVSATRFVLLPILGSIIVIGSAKLGIFTPPNPVFLIILVLQWCVPTANQMQNIAAMYDNYESAMGTLIFWQYLVMLFFVPFWLCINLVLFAAFDVYSTIPIS